MIIPWFFIPHMTYLCQPLDAKAFLSLKHLFKMPNSEVVAWGASNGKRDFFHDIDAVRCRTLKFITIQSSFESTGVWPWNHTQVMNHWGQYSDEETMHMYDEPLSAGEFPSSATNPPPNTYSRIKKLENTVFLLLDDTSPDLRKIRNHMRRAIDAGKSSLYNTELAKMNLTRALKWVSAGITNFHQIVCHCLPGRKISGGTRPRQSEIDSWMDMSKPGRHSTRVASRSLGLTEPGTKSARVLCHNYISSIGFPRFGTSGTFQGPD